MEKITEAQLGKLHFEATHGSPRYIEETGITDKAKFYTWSKELEKDDASVLIDTLVKEDYKTFKHLLTHYGYQE
jgi:hypothetical protein